MSSSGDSTARIWTIPDGPGSSTVQNGLQKPIVLKHYKGKTIEKCKDVTTLDWNVSFLALVDFVRIFFMRNLIGVAFDMKFQLFRWFALCTDY